LLDERFNYVSSSSGAQQVPAESAFNNSSSNNNVHVHQFENLPLNKNGYLYVFVSNETQILFSVNFLAKLSVYYDTADLIGKQQIIGSIFLEKMVFENNSFRTTKVNEVVELICRTSKHFKGNTTKESFENPKLSNVVPGTGIEPAHPCERQILS
jgi:hypothetical protein